FMREIMLKSGQQIGQCDPVGWNVTIGTVVI
ncbi:conserved hypothetical protein, partial [Trichinella spiralis]